MVSCDYLWPTFRLVPPSVGPQPTRWTTICEDSPSPDPLLGPPSTLQHDRFVCLVSAWESKTASIPDAQTPAPLEGRSGTHPDGRAKIGQHLQRSSSAQAKLHQRSGCWWSKAKWTITIRRGIPRGAFTLMVLRDLLLLGAWKPFSSRSWTETTELKPRLMGWARELPQSNGTRMTYPRERTAPAHGCNDSRQRCRTLVAGKTHRHRLHRYLLGERLHEGQRTLPPRQQRLQHPAAEEQIGRRGCSIRHRLSTQQRQV